MRTKEKVFRVEEWNGYDIYVDGSGTFFIRGEDRHDERAAEAKSIDALKKSLAVGQDVEIKGMMPTSRWGSDVENMSTVTVVKITGLGNLMYKRRADASPERAGKYEKIYVYDEARAAEAKRLRELLRVTNKQLQALIESWPVVKAPKK